jgi:DNA replication protein DnaC
MSEKIDETLKRLAAGMQKSNAGRSSAEGENYRADTGMVGDPDCPYCKGLGFLRLDVPVGHPEFGRVQVCSCRNQLVGQQVRQRLFQLSNLEELSHLTFENFNPRGRIGLRPQQADSLEMAYNQARQYAHSLNGWLLLQGKYGCGKTHLAAAIANFVVSLGVPTLFITVPDLLDSLRFAYHDPDTTFEERFEDIRQVPLLIMDDFGTQNATAWAQEKLFQILNYRYINRLPLVVTTNLPLDLIEPRILSRLQDPELVTDVRINATDYRRPTEDTGYHELSSLEALHERTFASFSLRKEEKLAPAEQKSLEVALTAAMDYAKDPHGWIVFKGTYGCGKTHIAAAIGNYWHDLGYEVVFMVVPDLLDHLRATFNPSSGLSLDRLFEDVKSAKLLILDDLGTESATPWVREKLYQLFNYRYVSDLPTVITYALYKNELDARLLSRMEDESLCRIYAITAPSYRGAPRGKGHPRGKVRTRVER